MGADSGGDGCAVLVITHREGLRDLSHVAGQPFRRTSYCCTAVFECSRKYKLQPPAWTLVASPEDFKAQQRRDEHLVRRRAQVNCENPQEMAEALSHAGVVEMEKQAAAVGGECDIRDCGEESTMAPE